MDATYLQHSQDSGCAGDDSRHGAALGALRCMRATAVLHRHLHAAPGACRRGAGDARLPSDGDQRRTTAAVSQRVTFMALPRLAAVTLRAPRKT